MDTKQMIEKLKSEAQNNKASNAVFHIFALRRRARNTVMLTSLYHKMRKEGFNFERADYVPLLKLLASLGFGTLDTDSKGRIRGLKNVRTTLQSIGEAAIGQGKDFSKWSQRNKFVPMTSAKVEKKEERKQELESDINLQLIINGKPVHVSVPKNFNTDEIVLLINKLKSA